MTLPLLWVDTETTGLNVDRDAIIEIGLILTTPDRIEIARWDSLVRVNLSDIARVVSQPAVLKVQEESGLWSTLIGSDGTRDLPILPEVEEAALAWLAENGVTEPSSVTFAGSAIGVFDMPILRRQMPRLHRLGTYFVHDIGVLRRAVERDTGRRINPGAIPHRALADVERAIAADREIARIHRAGVAALTAGGVL
ncbi:exonuclease domain-containing protein [Nostocoides jenkinsii]|uniref:Putative Oligoribonuclease n=1 Tax=Nostocoides jenkinsii Ben 74 TaxID=1193518 RepID=A0A077MEJ5_9MICO|nr:exonuclease domain-containing protein [Tetrasphaera jenkinsii]CCI53382.1 putative Oligoribonuclease [Tetrasphaera jenkinsii Ben 74]